MPIKNLLDLAKHPKGNAQRSVDDFKSRIEKRERAFEAQVKSQAWTQANDDFEYAL